VVSSPRSIKRANARLFDLQCLALQAEHTSRGAMRQKCKELDNAIQKATREWTRKSQASPGAERTKEKDKLSGVCPNCGYLLEAKHKIKTDMQEVQGSSSSSQLQDKTAKGLLQPQKSYIDEVGSKIDFTIFMMKQARCVENHQTVWELNFADLQSQQSTLESRTSSTGMSEAHDEIHNLRDKEDANQHQIRRKRQYNWMFPELDVAW